MNKHFPLIVVALIGAWAYFNLSQVTLWIIMGMLVAILIGFFVFLWSKDLFVGPGTLIDEFKESSSFFKEEDQSEEYRNEEEREKNS